MEIGFDLQKIFHQYKPVNTTYGTKDPTMSSNSWGYRNSNKPGNNYYWRTDPAVWYGGTGNEPGFISWFGQTGDGGRWKSEMYDNSMTQAGDELTQAGVIFVCAAGNSNQPQYNPDHPNYDNRISNNVTNTFYQDTFDEFGFNVTGSTNRRGFPQHIGKTESQTSQGNTTVKFPAINIGALDDDMTGSSDVAISMVPAHMHMNVAKACLKLGIHLLTASYLSDEMKELDQEVKAKKLVFLNECGLDPGIDHMSAMRLLDDIRDNGGDIKLFESFTGGLLSPESEGDNPWRYKFTWNPRNVVLAGQGGAVKFIQEGKYKYIPPHMVFRRTELINVSGYGKFEGLANRDSLKYKDAYKLEDVGTLYRGTLRRPGFARAWDSFVKLGMTDDSYVIEGTNDLTFREFTNLFLAYNPQDSVELKLKYYLNIPQDSDIMSILVWAGLFSDKKFPF